jgi:hypothetical protein
VCISSYGRCKGKGLGGGVFWFWMGLGFGIAGTIVVQFLAAVVWVWADERDKRRVSEFVEAREANALADSKTERGGL